MKDIFGTAEMQEDQKDLAFIIALMAAGLCLLVAVTATISKLGTGDKQQTEQKNK